VGLHWLSAILLFFSWLAALSALFVFLESWSFLSARDRFVARRASGAYGPVTVFLLMRGPAEPLEKTIRSVLAQSYPFLELFLIYFEEDAGAASLAHEFRTGSHVQVRLAPIVHALRLPDERIRALEQVQPQAKGRWYLVVDSGVALDRLAIESSLEFAGIGEVSAIVLRPGIQCRSFLERLLAPSMEYMVRLMRIARRRRERGRRVDAEAAYLLVNRDAFDAVTRMNRMPGILDESGWTLWGYQLEGLRTFDGDGARVMWRETRLASWSSPSLQFSHAAWVAVIAGAVTSFAPIVGLAFGLFTQNRGFAEATIFGFSTISYLLMTVSYFMHARRCGAAAWFAPFWFLTHLPASLFIASRIRPDDDHHTGRPESVKAGRF
jgi:hypothetical protein